MFEQLLYGYHDSELIQFIRFGWPIELSHCLEDRVDIPPNQKGARTNVQKVGQYLASEIKRGSVIGPFVVNPMGKEARFSPLDAIPKKDSQDLRIIMNLSFPEQGGSVNSAVNKNSYLGKDTDLKYPGIDDLVRLIQKKKSCLLFKRDLSKCYRQILMDPGIIHVLGFTFKGKYYFDVVLTMGLRIACYICQRITNALMYIYYKQNYEGINYLDDLGAAEVRRLAWAAFLALGKLLKDLGIWEAENKASPPGPSYDLS